MKNSAIWWAWAVKNVAVMACWTFLAAHFEKWWIALFAILCLSSLETKRGSSSEESDDE